MKRLTNEDFIKKSNKIHNYKYNYKLIEYINTNTKVKIICKFCNSIFLQKPRYHLQGQGCPNCINNKKYTFEKFLDLSNKKHKFKYEYKKFDYLNNKQYVDIICPKHGIFNQRIDMHLQGQGCPKCYNDTIINIDKFIIESNKIHNNKYEYGNKILNNYNIKIKCNTHGWFIQRIYNHLQGQGCPKCNNSKGENKIERYLIENNIKYEVQKKFKKCKNKRCLPFDFFLPQYNICIEYDGIYHYIDKNTIINDNIKTNFCKDNKIKLLRINLTNINDLNQLIIK